MENIFKKLKKPVNENIYFIKNHKLFKNEILENKINDLDIEANILNIFRVINDYNFEYLKHDFSKCPNSTPGTKSTILFELKKIIFIEKKCHCYAHKFFSKNYLYRDFPNNSLHFNLYKESKNKKDKCLIIKPERNEILRYLKTFCTNISNYKQNPHIIMKGLFVCGPPSVGKTYIMTALANWLAKKNFKIAFANTTSFANELKSNFNTTTTNKPSTLNIFKEAEVLFLDDLGNENNNSSWWRDDILFNLLDYRSKANLPTFISSNFNINQIKKIYAIHKEFTDNVQVDRLIKRILTLCEVKILKQIS